MNDMPISLPTGVSLRGGVYQLRIGIPDDIKHLWLGKANGKSAADAYRKSLRTSDKREAIARALEIIADYARQFEDLRARQRPMTPTPITAELVSYIIQRQERDILALDDLLRSNPRYLADMIRSTAPRGWMTEKPMVIESWDAVGDYLDPEQYENASDIRKAVVYRLRTDYMRGNLEVARNAAGAACAALSIKVDWSEATARASLQQILGAILRAWEAAGKRDSGEPIETPEEPVVPATVTVNTEKEQETAMPEKVTLRDVVPSWVIRTSAKENARARTEHALRLFEDAVGAVDLKTITKGTGAAFVRYLLDVEARKFGSKTAANHAAAITALMNIAVKEDLLERNPMDLSFDKSSGAETREPWTDAELAKIYGSALFSAAMDTLPLWHNVTAKDGRAALLLLLHTGARPGEIAQLRCEDFQVRGGIAAIRITAEAGTVKTKESERTIPLASHLLQDPWFAEWLNTQEGTQGVSMPSFHGRSRGPSDTFGQWFRQLRDSLGLPQGKLAGAHRFRHWIRSALAEMQIGEATMDSITGHSAQGSSGRKTYTHAASLATMKAALDSIHYPEIAG